MKLDELQKIGGFVSKEPAKEELTWTPPEGEPVTFTVFIKRLSAGAIERLWVDTRKEDRSHSAALISESVWLGEDGKERLSYDQAFQLEMTLATALLDAIDRVNPHKTRTVAAVKN